MGIFLCILKAIGGWIILTLIGANLLGLSVRGLFGYIQKYDESSVAGKIISEHNRTSSYISLFFTVITIAYIFALYHFWNIGIALAAVILMASRLPDLIEEIKTGKKFTLGAKTKTPKDFLISALQWGALPLIWYSLCYIK